MKVFQDKFIDYMAGTKMSLNIQGNQENSHRQQRDY